MGMSSLSKKRLPIDIKHYEEIDKLWMAYDKDEYKNIITGIEASGYAKERGRAIIEYLKR